MSKSRNTTRPSTTDIVRDTLSNVTLLATTSRNYKVTKLAGCKNSCILISNNLSHEDMEIIATELSRKDLICETAGENSNFLIISENPHPTPKTIIEKYEPRTESAESVKITRIPITLSEGFELAKKISSDLGIVENGAGPQSFVVIYNSNKSNRSLLAELAQKLCEGGLYVTHMAGSNFIVVKDAPEVKTTERLSENTVSVEEKNEDSAI